MLNPKHHPGPGAAASLAAEPRPPHPFASRQRAMGVWKLWEQLILVIWSTKKPQIF